VHLAEAGVHSSEAIVVYSKSLDHGPWHTFHMSRKRVSIPNWEEEGSGDGFSKLAVAALEYEHCQPLNISYIKLGWYDKLKPNSVRAVHRSSFARS
jgi:hypothetical protein